MTGPSLTVQALRAARFYLEDLVESPAEVDDDIRAILQRDLEGDDIASQLEGLLDAQPALQEWLGDFIDLGAPPEVALARYKSGSVGAGGYAPLPGYALPVSAPRFTCPVDGLYVWYRPTIGTPVPNCRDHRDTRLVPAEP